ncbi:MAG: site-2 protease family protein [Candidatus Aminicenantales bacterium]
MFKHKWRVARIFGITINIDPSWLVIFILFTWSLAGYYFPQNYPHWSKGLAWGLGLLTSLLIFISVLIHELTHCLVARQQGDEVSDITLFLLGGVAQIREEPDEPLKEFGMAVVGPVSSFILAGIFFGLSVLLSKVSQPLSASAFYLAVINAGLAVFNLLPGFPLDGGRVLRAIAWKITGDLKKATRLASLVGQAVAFLLIAAGFLQILRGQFSGLWLILIGLFLQSAAARGYEQAVVRSLLQGVKAKDLMSTEFSTVPAGLTIQALVDDFVLHRKERVFLVMDQESGLQGIICLEDIKASPKENWPWARVRDVMTPKEKLEAVSPDADGSQVLASLTSRDINQVPVMDGDRLAGIICRTDLLRFIQLKTELKL